MRHNFKQITHTIKTDSPFYSPNGNVTAKGSNRFWDSDTEVSKVELKNELWEGAMRNKEHFRYWGKMAQTVNMLCQKTYCVILTE